VKERDSVGVKTTGTSVTINIESERLSDELQAAFPVLHTEILNAINIGNEYRPGRFKATDGSSIYNIRDA